MARLTVATPLDARRTAMLLAACALMLLLAACGVREEDTAAWPGQPVAVLEQHPVFLTMPVAKTRTSDGTEIWNFINSRTASSCSGVGTLIAGNSPYISGTAFQSCMSSTAACNNLFYIKGGIVQRYTPIGSGGARCYTDDRAKPGFSKPTNFR